MNRQDHDRSNPGKRWMKHARHLGAVASSNGPHVVAKEFRDDLDVDTKPSKLGGWGDSIRKSAREFLGVADSPKVSGAVVLNGSSVDTATTCLAAALTLSMVTGRRFQIVEFRAAAADPGLRPEDLGLIKAAATLRGATLEGDERGSLTLGFRPLNGLPRDLSIDLGAAGLAPLLVQTLHLPLALKARRASRLTVLGQTLPLNGPSFPILNEAWRGQMARLGAPVALAMPPAGFAPEGTGQIEAWIEPAPARLRTVRWTTRGRLVKLRGVVGFGNLGRDAAERLKALVETRLRFEGFEAQIEVAEWQGASPAVSIQLTATHENGPKGSPPTAFVGIAEPGTAPEKAAADAVDAFLRFERVADAAIDPQSAGPLLLALALAEGGSEFTVSEVTRNLQATAQTLRAFLPGRSISIVEAADSTSAARVAVA